MRTASVLAVRGQKALIFSEYLCSRTKQFVFFTISGLWLGTIPAASQPLDADVALQKEVRETWKILNSSNPSSSAMPKQEPLPLHVLLQKAEQGDISAQTYLGIRYWAGDGVPQNYKESFRWYLRAADAGDTLSQVIVADMYESGRGIPKNDEKAIKWYTHAAKTGDREAQFSLGYKLYHGQGVAQNYEEAFKWYKQAAEQKHPFAYVRVGSMYRDGKGVPQSNVQAYRWFSCDRSEEALEAQRAVVRQMTAVQLAEARLVPPCKSCCNKMDAK